MTSVQPPGFPVSVRAAQVDVGGEPTDIVCSKYEDAVLLVISQIGCFGTIIRARPDASAAGRTTYSTSVLMGRRDEPLLILAARQLVEASVEAGNVRPLTVTLGLKQHSMEVVKQLVAAVKEQGLLR